MFSRASVWPFELELCSPGLRYGPLSWSYVLPGFGMAPRVGVMDSRASVRPLELELWTPGLRYGPSSWSYGPPRFGPPILDFGELEKCGICWQVFWEFFRWIGGGGSLARLKSQIAGLSDGGMEEKGGFAPPKAVKSAICILVALRLCKAPKWTCVGRLTARSNSTLAVMYMHPSWLHGLPYSKGTVPAAPPRMHRNPPVLGGFLLTRMRMRPPPAFLKIGQKHFPVPASYGGRLKYDQEMCENMWHICKICTRKEILAGMSD